ncbi:MAG: FixG Ig-like domain-containing protein, partial [Geminicoccaceae bacterium]
KVLNRVREPKTYALSVGGLDGTTLSVFGQEVEDGQPVLLDGEPDQVSTYRLFVTAPAGSVDQAVNDLDVVLTDQATGEAFAFDTVFRGPK